MVPTMAEVVIGPAGKAVLCSWILRLELDLTNINIAWRCQKDMYYSNPQKDRSCLNPTKSSAANHFSIFLMVAMSIQFLIKSHRDVEPRFVGG